MKQVTHDMDLNLESEEVQRKFREAEATALITGEVFCGLNMQHQPVFAMSAAEGKLILVTEKLKHLIDTGALRVPETPIRYYEESKGVAI